MIELTLLALLLIAAVLGVCIWCSIAPQLAEEQKQRDRRVQAMRDRADHQQAQRMVGDERGVYGQYKPYC